jgi:hypothetical protein
MRRAIVAIGAGLIMSLSTAAGFAATSAPAGAAAASNASASGPEWCGFQDKAGSRVRCGFTNESDCKQAVGGPDAVCIVDPYFTERRRVGAVG